LVSKDEADDDASTRAVRESPSRNSTTKSSLDAGDNIPTIRISTESDLEAEKAKNLGPDVNGNGDAKVNGLQNAGDTVEKPVQAAAENGPEGNDSAPTAATTTDAFSISNKRLCERRLDNLFMELYEDLRV